MLQPFIKISLAGVVGISVAGAALSIAPASHNFGKVAVMGSVQQAFTVTLPSGVARGASLTYAIAGPDAADFILPPPAGTIDPFDPMRPCPPGPQGRACSKEVVFWPHGLGPKQATLVVTDNSGNRATAALSGEGVKALCTNTVVWCNYAIHYSGVVSYAGEAGHVNVDVVQGVASCNAASPGESGLTTGPGLIGVEFGRDGEMPGGFYRITVACPIHYTSEPGYPAVPDRPAELGHGEFGSYKQPLGMPLAQVNVGPPRLKGTNSEGDVVSWDLCPNGQYQIAPIPDSGEREDQRRCTP